MDNIRFKLIISFVLLIYPLVSFSAFPNQGRYSSLKSGIQTMFKFNYGGESFSIEGTAPPETSNVIKLSEKLAAENSPYGGASYTSIQKLKVGAEGNVVGFKVRNAVPKTKIVDKLAPALKFIGRNTAGALVGTAVLGVGTALYHWFTDAGINPDLSSVATDGMALNVGWCRGDGNSYGNLEQQSCLAIYSAVHPGAQWVWISGTSFRAMFPDGENWRDDGNFWWSFDTAPDCPGGGNFNYTTGQCSATSHVLTEQEIKDKLLSTPVPAGLDGNALAEAVNRGLAAEAEAKAEGLSIDFVPDSDPVPQVDVPPNIAMSPVTTVAPDGTVQEVAKEIAFSPGPTPDTVAATEHSTVTNTAPNGAVTQKTIDNAPSDTTPQAVPTKVQCDLYPDTLGCASLEVAVTPDQVPNNPVSIGLSPSSWGTGSCPVDVVVNAPMGKSATFSYAPVCQFLSSLSPVLISIGWIIAGWMVIGGIKD